MTDKPEKQCCRWCKFAHQRFDGDDYRRCQRMPPTLVPSDLRDEVWGQWPLVQTGDWCGEFQWDEQKQEEAGVTCEEMMAGGRR